MPRVGPRRDRVGGVPSFTTGQCRRGRQVAVADQPVASVGFPSAGACTLALVSFVAVLVHGGVRCLRECAEDAGLLRWYSQL